MKIGLLVVHSHSAVLYKQPATSDPAKEKAGQYRLREFEHFSPDADDGRVSEDAASNGGGRASEGAANGGGGRASEGVASDGGGRVSEGAASDGGGRGSGEGLSWRPRSR